VGNDEYAREEPFLSDSPQLRDRHVEIQGRKNALQLPRQERVDPTVSITGPAPRPHRSSNARICRGTSFSSNIDPSGKRQTISSDDSERLSFARSTGRDITAKDFRTWRARCSRRGRELFLLGPAKEPARSERNISARSTPWRSASQHAHRVPQVLRSPGLVRAYLQGLTAPLSSAPPDEKARREHPTAALRREESPYCSFCRKTPAEA